MKKILLLIAVLAVGFSVKAQDAETAYEAAAEGAVAIEEAEQAAQSPVAKPKYWDNSLSTNINFGQNGFFNWAAGGYNNYTLKAYVDAKANYAKGNHAWTNRLQLDYGFMYSADKPVLQKSDDRIYLESKYAYTIAGKFNATAELSFKSQFSNTYSYSTPAAKDDGSEPTHKDWMESRTLNSGFASPSYTNLALGIEYVPTKWLTINLAPITGGIVSVDQPSLRESYSMPVKSETEDYDAETGETSTVTTYKAARFEFGAQLKVDIAVNINDNFKYTSQIVLFSNYLSKPQNIRTNWDNRFEWTLAKYFSLVLTTNLIYDDTVLITKGDEEVGHPRVQ
ncbi:MAG: DUF3078 domain-containing protein, partial [Bacteroidales bacterium]|nr:DUF3078 domain-containing protein [Bacteroidales bacterium]